ncbi:zinc-ribbon domain-containing protein, partial [Falsiroseomonas oryziterrae]
MRVACPACAAAYEIPDELLASGPRLLQCAACGAQFEAVP